MKFSDYLTQRQSLINKLRLNPNEAERNKIRADITALDKRNLDARTLTIEELGYNPHETPPK